MSKTFLSHIDLASNELQNARVHNLASDPSGLGTGDKGRVWFNTTSNVYKWWDGTAAQVIPSQAYVDNAVQGIDHKASVRAATTGNITISNPGTATFDGITLSTGDRLLVKNQSAAAENGIYIFNGTSTALTRATDMDAWGEIPGAFTFVEQGGTLADTSWVSTADTGGTLGTTAITWTQFGAAAAYTAGDGLTLTGNQFSLTSPVAVSRGGTNATTAAGARTSLGATGKYAADITGTGSATQFTVNHALSSTDIAVTVWDVTANAEVIVDKVRVDANNVRIDFAVAPVNGKVYRVVVVG